MRTLSILAATALLCGAATAQAQTPVQTAAPKLPSPTIYSDTVVISAFDIVQPSSQVQLKATVLGLKPTGYRVSKYANFSDMLTFAPWPSSNVPVWTSPSASGTCGANTFKIVGYFQVRAIKSTKKFVNSNVARDTLCILFG